MLVLTSAIRQSTLVLASAFMINFTACGLLFGFGVYQAHYESMALDDGTPFSGVSPANMALIGTLSVALMTIGAPVAVAWAKNFNPQVVVFAGGVLFGVACIAASFGKALWHFQLSQGLLLGIGTCLSFVPLMTVAPTWFDKHRGLAMGFISAGTGIGGLVWAPVIIACIAHSPVRPLRQRLHQPLLRCTDRDHATKFVGQEALDDLCLKYRSAVKD